MFPTSSGSPIDDSSNHLPMMSSMESASDYDDHLMQELDSGLMQQVEDSTQSGLIMQHMDIQEPLYKLRQLLEQRLGLSLQEYQFYLQGSQMLESDKTLVEQCVQGQGYVQINVQLQVELKRINILDVLKPAEDYINVDESKKSSPAKPVIQWQVDVQYKKLQERLKIPEDPIEWSTMHVRHWIQWAVRQFDLTRIRLADWCLDGRQLYELTPTDFKVIVPEDPGDVFWTHLELLRKTKVVAVKRSETPSEVSTIAPGKHPIMNASRVSRLGNTYASSLSNFEASSTMTSPSKSSSNASGAQIQLWQFLLELLTTKEYKKIITWTGKEGEFKLKSPQMVAQLWGERKNKPAMNYEKLSRALRYYYDGDMISKVHGERFVYKFVCDLKELLGYDAKELANLVDHGNPMRTGS